MIPITTAFYAVPALTFLTLLFIMSFSYETKINKRGFNMLIVSFVLYLVSTLIYAIFINAELDKLQSIPFVILMSSNFTFYISTCLLLNVKEVKRFYLKVVLYIIVPTIFHAYVVLFDAPLFLRGFTSTLISMVVFINVLIDINRARSKGVISQKFTQLDMFVGLYVAILLVGLIGIVSRNVNYEHAWLPVEVMGYVLSSVVRIALGFGYTLVVQKMLFHKTTNTEYVHLTEYDFVKQVSETDHLTSIYNRQKIDKILLKYVDTDNTHFSVLFIDVNDFKQINDKHGHLVGDEVLVSIAQTLQSSLRATDFVGRWGGDEFLVVLDEAKEENVDLVVKKLKDNVQKLEVKDLTNISISVGAFTSCNNECVAEILNAVDQRLYTDKDKYKVNILKSA